jgi:hypothetical protein
MLHMLQLVLVVFRRFSKPTDNSVQHERDKRRAGIALPPVPGDGAIIFGDLIGKVDDVAGRARRAVSVSKFFLHSLGEQLWQ